METRRIEGSYVGTGTTDTLFQCTVRKDHGPCSTAVWKAHDGDIGSFCFKCRAENVKSPVVGVQVERTKYVPGRVDVKCCGHWLECDRFTNTCDHCGRDYNFSGQLLAHRSQWGEETGETASDVLGL